MRLNILKRKLQLRIKRKKRIRANIFGTAVLPRVSIFRSNRRIYIQAIDDGNSKTLIACDGKKLGLKANKESAKIIGAKFAELLKNIQINEAIFDRNGYLYHGVVAAVADAIRDNGIKL